MSRYFDWPSSLKRFLRGDTARAEDVNAALDQLSAGMDTLDQDVDRAIKLPSGTTDQVLAMTAGQRANLLLAFDAEGDIAAVAGGGRYRGDWVTNTDYVASDYVRDAVSKNIYATVVAHKSGVLANDIAADKMRLAINVADVGVFAQAASDSAAAAEQSRIDAVAQITGIKGDAEAARDAAQGHATDADTARGLAVVAQGGAELAETNAQTAYTNLDKRFLGAKASDPATDNQGAALATGAMYYNTGTGRMLVWGGSAWEATYLPVSGYQATLVSGTNIKTVNNTSLLGAGDVSTAGRGDVLLTNAALTAPAWLECGRVYLQSSYPNLFAQLGFLPDAKGRAVTLPITPSFGAGGAQGVVVGASSSTSGAYSTNGGASWTTVTFPITAARLAGSGSNFVISDSTTSGAYSTDGGASWTTVTFPVSASAIAGSGSNFVISDTGTSGAYSTNGGATWTTVTFPVSATRIAGSGSNFVITQGGSASGAYSTNGGATWTTVTLPLASGWVAGGGSNFLTGVFASTSAAYSANGGASWTPVTLPFKPAAAVGTGKNFVIIHTSEPVAAYSTDGGASWTVFDLPFQATSLAGDGVGFVAMRNATGAYCVPAVYDRSTQFGIPEVATTFGLKAYMKA